MPTPRRLLKDMRIGEISLVDSPMNVGARAVLFKRAAKPGRLETVLARLLGKQGKGKDKGKKDSELQDLADEVENDDDLDETEKAAALRQLFDDYTAAVTKCQGVTKMDEKELQAAIAKATSEAVAKLKEEHEASMAKASAAAEERIKKAEETAAAEAKKSADAIAKLQETHDDAERLAKAKAAVGAASGIDVVDLAKTLKSVPADAQETFLKTISAVAEQAIKAQKILTTTTGVLTPSGAGAATALQKLQTAADELVTKADGKLSKEQAFTKACQANPQLYAEYIGKAN